MSAFNTTGRHQYTHCDNGGLVPAQELLQLAEFQSNFNQALQTLGGRLAKRCGASRSGYVSLHVHAHSGTLASRATETEDDARAIGEGDDLTLVLRHRVVNGVFVLKVVQTRHSEAS